MEESNLPGSSVHGISQARILEWVAISYSRGSSWHSDRTQVCCIASKLFTIWATMEACVCVCVCVCVCMYISVHFSCSVISDSANLWTAACQASLSITSSQNLLKLMSIESVMPSNHLILTLSSLSPLAFNLSQNHSLFKWVSSLHQVAKYWSFSFSISPSNEYPGLISF